MTDELEIDLPETGHDLYLLRVETCKGRSQEDFARALGVSTYTYRQNWEKADLLPLWKARAARDAAIELILEDATASWADALDGASGGV